MAARITTGNAVRDGRDFHFWFVGQIEEWCRQKRVPFHAGRFGLRNTSEIEIKWGLYPAGEERASWAGATEKTAMSILVRGDLVFSFQPEEEQGPPQEVRLRYEGDYVIWREDLLHTWRMNEDSVILTLRW